MTAHDRRLLKPAAHETAGTAPPIHQTPNSPDDAETVAEPETEPQTAPDATPDPRSWRSGYASSNGESAPSNGEADRAHPRYTTRRDVESLGVSLGPALHEACGDRLGDIEWFQSPWQHSGAATGFTYWRLPDGRVIDAIVKVPVGYREYFWTTGLGEVDPMWWNSERCRHLPVPRVCASGMTLKGYDIAWLVIERISGKPISRAMSASNLERLFAAAAHFHRLASELKPAADAAPPPPPDWMALLDRAAEACRDNEIQHTDRWLRVIDRTREMLPDLVERWSARVMDSWCHGDLHPGNVLMRCDATCPGEQCGVLIDLGLVHAGHWVEDALYLERMYWGREPQLCGGDPIATLARHRLALGMHADETDAGLADIRRVLMGATSPAYLRQENDPRYLSAALSRLESVDPLIK